MFKEKFECESDQLQLIQTQQFFKSKHFHDELNLFLCTGFRRDASALNSILTKQELIDKIREYSLETHLLCVDHEKAFGKMSRTKRLTILMQMDFPKHLVKLMNSFYIYNTKITVDMRQTKIETFEEIDSGLRQGETSSPLINTNTDEAVRNCVKEFIILW